MDTTATQISSYRKTLFEARMSDGHLISHDVYRRGAGAPVVVGFDPAAAGDGASTMEAARRAGSGDGGSAGSSATSAAAKRR